MKEQRGVHTSRLEEKVQLNSIVYEAFKKALKAGLDNGVDKTLPIIDFLQACELNPESANDPLMVMAFNVVVLGKKE
jgi:hypothetical protein